MWQRNLLFAFVCLFGMGVLFSQLLSGEPLDEPTSFDPGNYNRGDFNEVVSTIDNEFQAEWQSAGLRPAPRADDLTIARRLSLALTGTVPSLEEIRALEAEPAEHRIQWWISHLMEDRRYSDYAGERLARAYVGTENGPFIVFRRRRFVIWLSDRLHENTPYDELVRNLIADEGLWTDSPSVNFITVTANPDDDNQPDEIRLARRVSRAFLGVRLDCVQCHDDMFSDRWKQTHFHELAAFFGQTRSTFTGVSEQPWDEEARDRREYLYQYLYEDEEEIVLPRVPFAEECYSDVGTRRQQLADWVTHPRNKAFARTTVNRFWALLFGVPLVDPIDSIPLEGPYPPALEALAEDFIVHRFDVQRLIRVIAATEAFQRDSRAPHEITAEHEAHFAAFPLSRLRPEQVAGALLQSASLETIDHESHIIWQLQRFDQQNNFVTRYGDTGEDEFDSHGGTIPQRLVMLNGNLVQERTKEDLISNAATRIAQLAPDDATAVEAAYLTVLTRRPTEKESAHFAAKLAGLRGGERSRALGDLYWVLLNSTEFSWNH